MAVPSSFAELIKPDLLKVYKLEIEEMGYGFSHDGDDPVELSDDAIITRQTDKAVLCTFDMVKDYWIPKSALHPNSKVRATWGAYSGPGRLVIKKWFARKAGLL